MGPTLSVLLVDPASPRNYWTFSEAADIIGDRRAFPNLALPTLAALTPAEIDIDIIDDNTQEIDFDRKYDVVGITGYITHRHRMIEIATEFRQRGQLVAIGGPYASLSPTTLRPHADVLFVGEAEETWPQFLADLRAGEAKDRYEPDAPPDMRHSPTPRMDLLDGNNYLMGAVQTSRGCPFSCEFCDVIVYLGRRQRHKEPEQVVAELQSQYDLGFRQIFLSDDNLTANISAARAILEAVAEWNAGLPERVSFNTQMSIDVAVPRNEAFLDLCSRAGLEVAFVGVETANEAALLEVSKKQNIGKDVVEAVRYLASKNIAVQAGLILGFDSDTTDCFEQQRQLAQEAAFPMISVSVLNAPEGTPLEKRLLAENRITGANDSLYFNTNIVPKLMSVDVLIDGAKWLVNNIYDPANYLERMEAFAASLPILDQDHPMSPNRSKLRETLQLWSRVERSYEQLGPEFAGLPRDIARLMRGRSPSHIFGPVIFYRHVVGVFQHWGVWNPDSVGAPPPTVEHSTPVSMGRTI